MPVLLYPQRNGAGGGDQSQPSLVPENLVDLYLKNGWGTTPNVENPRVAEKLIADAQAQVRQTLTNVSEREVELARREAALLEREQALKSPKKTEV